MCIFGKTWDFHVIEILRASLDENLEMIRDTMKYLREQGRTVIYDAEHYFDGYLSNPAYALSTLRAAVEGGAQCLTLCDTNGGCLPDAIREMTETVVREFGVPVGIHCHNDGGMAVANSLMAVKGGAVQVQGTLIGFGERTGNANLSTIIANLELKMGLPCLPAGKVATLTPMARRVAEIANVTMDDGMPFVGHTAFAHKAGMHIDAMTKNPKAYEHVHPDSVGNERTFLMSEVAGRSMIIEKIRKFDPAIGKDSPVAQQIVDRLKTLEHEGYQFEGAEGSFELVVRKNMGKYKPFFDLHYYKLIGEQPDADQACPAFAQIKIGVDGVDAITAGEGDGPVHALDCALRTALERFYPGVREIRLTDFKVRVLDSKSATAAKVRVLIESVITSYSIHYTKLYDPECAMSDGAQSLYPEQFEKMMRDIEVLAPVVGRTVSRRTAAKTGHDRSGAKLEAKRAAGALALSGAAGPVVCAYSGGRGAYAEIAIRRFWDNGATALSAANFREVINAVLGGGADFRITSYNVCYTKLLRDRGAT